MDGFGGKFGCGLGGRRKGTAALDAGGVFDAVCVCCAGGLVSRLAKTALERALDQDALFFVVAVGVFFAETVVSCSSDKVAGSETFAGGGVGVGEAARFVAEGGYIGGGLSAL